jgi:hypothetical protein
MRRLLAALVAALALAAGAAAAAPTSAREALTLLKTLQARATADLAYGDYHRQVTETRNAFETYAERTSATVADANAKAALSSAMNYHRFAESTWAAKLRRNGELTLSSFDPLVILAERFPCPALRALIDPVVRRWAAVTREEERAAVTVDRGVSDRVVRVLWSCAGDAIAEAEKILGPARP